MIITCYFHLDLYNIFLAKSGYVPSQLKTLEILGRMKNALKGRQPAWQQFIST